VVCIVRCVCSVALLQLFCAAGVWSCPSCTYDNEFGAEACEMCDKPRPGASGMPWLVPFDAAAGRRDLGPDAGAGLVCSAPRSGTLLHAQSKLGLHAGQPAAHAGGGDGRCSVACIVRPPHRQLPAGATLALRLAAQSSSPWLCIIEPRRSTDRVVRHCLQLQLQVAWR
jgi:hypothetical protein